MFYVLLIIVTRAHLCPREKYRVRVYMLCEKTREKHGENARFVERDNRVFDQFDLKTVGLGSFMHEGTASNASFRKMPNQHYADTCTRLREHRFCIICVRLSRAHFQ